MSWAKNDVRSEFTTMIFSDGCRAILDGPDGLIRSLVLHGKSPPKQIRKQLSETLF